MKRILWGLLWPLFLLSSDGNPTVRRLSTSPRPIYVEATTKVRSNGNVLLNMECHSELFEPNKTIEVELRVYRPGKPIKTVHLSIDV